MFLLNKANEIQRSCTHAHTLFVIINRSVYIHQQSDIGFRSMPGVCDDLERKEMRSSRL